MLILLAAFLRLFKEKEKHTSSNNPTDYKWITASDLIIMDKIIFFSDWNAIIATVDHFCHRAEQN